MPHTAFENFELKPPLTQEMKPGSHMYLPIKNWIFSKGNGSQQHTMSYYDYYMKGKSDSSKRNFKKAIFQKI